MAKPEQTEKATPKRVREARERGQVPRSVDIGGASIFLAIITTIHAGFLATMDMMGRDFQIAFANVASHQEVNIFSAWHLFIRSGLPYVGLLGLIFLAALTLGVGANLLQFGFLFSPKLLQPKFSKLNPASGIKRVFFSPQTLVNFAKQMAKLSVVVVIVYLGVKDSISHFFSLAHVAPREMVQFVEGICFGIGVRFGILLLLLGIADYFWEKKQLGDSLKMTKTEVKDENKQAEGNPEAKAALRNRQRAMARRRMMAAVPRATVVVTNPTHYAIALEWDELKMAAPVLTAKGADLLAKRIREIAKENDVPILENAPLARALYDKVALDTPVPADLYAAVAQVIAFVYRLKNKTIA